MDKGDMLGLGFQELLMILIIVLFLFGGKKLPEIASGLGKVVREFKRTTSAPTPPSVANRYLLEPSATEETSHSGAHTRG
jgi:sec-independent protein translocase protein TatA